MDTSEIRELAFAELEQVAGGVDGYQYCSHGPAGEGLYAPNVDCRNAYDFLIEMIAIGENAGRGGRPS
jgi:hypothetical protein